MNLVEPIRDKKKIEAIKKILKSSSIRNYCFFTLGINSGLRISDLLSLKISDVIDDKNKIKDRISLKEKKTGKTKDFPVSDVAKKVIKEYLDARKYDSSERKHFIHICVIPVQLQERNALNFQKKSILRSEKRLNLFVKTISRNDI